MMKLFKIYASLILTLTATGSHAVCSGSWSSIDEAREDARTFTQNMTVARARGDIAYMGDAYSKFYEQKLGRRNACSEQEVAKICNFSCQMELGQYHLFMASEIAYYYSKSIADSAPVIEQAELQKWVNDGVTLVETAKANLAKQLSNDGNGDFDLSDYVTRSSRFNILLIKLLIAAGDNWYQTLSETKLERLRYLVAHTGNAPEDSASTQNQARALYERANWVLQSASLDIPDGPVFSGFVVEFAALRDDLKRRINSLNKGFLFLDIDPEVYPNISTGKLRKELEKLSQNIDEVEKNIGFMIKEWHDRRLNQDVDQINESRRANELSISESSYKIGKLEGLSNEFYNEYEAQVNNIKGDINSFEYQRERFSLRVGLKSKLDELKQRQTQIISKKEVDIIAFNQATTNRQIGDLRWLMNWEIAKNNIALQLSQFDSQKTEYESRKFRKEKTLKQLDSQYDSNVNRIDIATTQQNNALLQIDRINTSREDMADENRRSLETQLCSTKNQLRYLGFENLMPNYKFENRCDTIDFDLSIDEYQEGMCGIAGLRREQAVQEARTVKEALCFIGLENLQAYPHIIKVNELNFHCAGETSYSQAKAIFDKKMKLADLEIASSEAQIDNLKSQIRVIVNNFDLAKITKIEKASLEAITLAAQIAQQGAAVIPTATTCACSLASGIMTMFDSYKPFKIAADIADRALALGVDWRRYIYENQGTIKSLTDQLEILENKLDIKEYTKLVQNQKANEALFEITGRTLNYSNEYASSLIQQDVINLDCDKENNDLLFQAEHSASQAKQLVAELKLLELHDDVFANQIAEQQNLIAINQSQIAILENSNAELDIEIETVNQEIETIVQLLADNESRKQSVITLSGKLDNLEDKAANEELVLKELEKMALDKSIALSDSEFTFATTVITDAARETLRLKEFSDKLEELEGKDNQLTKEMIAYREDIGEKISAEREKMLAGIQKQTVDADTNEKEKLFMATEEDLAMLTEGIPHFVAAKRKYLERANRMLVLLRNRLTVAQSLAGDRALTLADATPVTYVKTHTDLTALIELAEEESFLNTDSPILTSTTSINFDETTAVARDLVTHRKAVFEISPIAAYDPAKFGGYSSWSSVWNVENNHLTQNLQLVDVNLAVKFSDDSCSKDSGKIYSLTHLGHGAIFKQAAPNDSRYLPSLVVTNERRKYSNYDTYDELDNLRGLITDVIKFWKPTQYLSGFLESLPPNDRQGILPLMGLPVIGSYELALGNPPSGCSYEDATFRLFFTYSSTPAEK